MQIYELCSMLLVHSRLKLRSNLILMITHVQEILPRLSCRAKTFDASIRIVQLLRKNLWGVLLVLYY
jgi:hypothetical protein